MPSFSSRRCWPFLRKAGIANALRGITALRRKRSGQGPCAARRAKLRRNARPPPMRIAAANAVSKKTPSLLKSPFTRPFLRPKILGERLPFLTSLPAQPIGLSKPGKIRSILPRYFLFRMSSTPRSPFASLRRDNFFALAYPENL